MRRARALALGVCCAIGVGGACGQITVDDVVFGWNKQLSPQRWNPLTLKVSGGPAGFSGLVRVEFVQDSTQAASVTAPIAATPGASTTVVIPFAPAASIQSAQISIEGPDGAVYRQVFSMQPKGREQFLDAQVMAGQPTVMIAGESSARELASVPAEEAVPNGPTTITTPLGGTVVYSSGPGDDEATDTPERRARRWKQAVYIDRAFGELPSDWILYDAFECVLLSEANAGDPSRPGLGTREVASLRSWVSAGGWLVVLAGPGDSWRRWVTDTDADDPIAIEPLGRVDVPGELVKLVEGVKGKDGEKSAASATVSARRMSLTDAGRRAGWKVRWGAGPDSGLAVDGPLGLGMVTVLGVDPRAVSAIVSADATRAVWRDAMGPAMEPSMRRGQQPMGFGMYFMDSSGATPEQTVAIGQALDSVAVAPSVGIEFFVGIAIGMSLLTLLLGPGNAIGLKLLRLRHRSWLVGLGWIGAGSVAAYLLPLAFRSGASSVRTASMIDAVLRADGTPIEARRTSVTGIYAQRSARFGLVDPRDRESVEGRWARGVSASTGFGGRRTAFEPLALLLVQGASERACVPSAVAVPQWTFRAVMEEAPARVPAVSVTSEPSGALRVEMQGLPESVTITDARVEYRGQTRGLSQPTEGQASGTRHLITDPGRVPSSSTPTSAAAWSVGLPGADRRGDAIQTRASVPDAAVLYVDAQSLEPLGPARASDGPVATAHRAMYRIVVPVSRVVPEGDKP